MEFLELNAEVIDLRRSLLNFVGENALAEISVRPPVGHSDEASFLRLVSWSYALIFEAGSIAIPYLIKLPSEDHERQSSLLGTCQVVRCLRTWTSHNLGLSEHDVSVSRDAMNWMRTACSNDSPTYSTEWTACFSKLCSEVSEVTKYCQYTVNNVLLSSADGEDILADLRGRIDRNWPAHKFDAIVGDICARFGEKMDVKKFRQPRIHAWRKYIDSLSADSDLEYQARRRIESDVIDYFSNMLPIDGKDVMQYLGIEPGPQVSQALTYARAFFDPKVHDKEALLEGIREHFNTVQV